VEVPNVPSLIATATFGIAAKAYGNVIVTTFVASFARVM